MAVQPISIQGLNHPDYNYKYCICVRIDAGDEKQVQGVNIYWRTDIKPKQQQRLDRGNKMKNRPI
jgi:hypothetical protein